MVVKRYADKELAKEIAKQVREADGHCPCVLPALRNEDTLCMCKNFREAPAGTICDCGLYIKVED
jgi:hypothetical protein